MNLVFCKEGYIEYYYVSQLKSYYPTSKLRPRKKIINIDGYWSPKNNDFKTGRIRNLKQPIEENYIIIPNNYNRFSIPGRYVYIDRNDCKFALSNGCFYIRYDDEHSSCLRIISQYEIVNKEIIESLKDSQNYDINDLKHILQSIHDCIESPKDYYEKFIPEDVKLIIETSLTSKDIDYYLSKNPYLSDYLHPKNK